MSSTLLLGLAIVLAVAGVLVMRRSPRLAFVLWTATICFVPYWLGVTVQVYWSPGTLVGALLVIALLPAPGRWGLVDLMIAVIVGVFIFGVVAGYATIASGYVLVAQWALGYLIGRLVASRVGLSWIYGTLVIAMTVVSILAIVEYLTHFNFFVLLRASNTIYTTWSAIQIRGGVARSEGAFGHSIALGVSIAAVVPLVVVARFPLLVRLAMLMVMTLAVVTTFSRISMICTGLGFLATILFLRSGLTRRVRALFLGITVVVAAIASPIVITTFTDAGTEATNSAGYRGNLLSLLPDLSPVGLTPIAYRSASGEVYYGSFQSIDNAILFLGLNHGLIPMIMVLALLALGVVWVLSGRGTPPLIAVCAQIPALATVALITQQAEFFWFIVGLAVSTLHMSREEASLVISSALEEIPSGTADVRRLVVSWRRPPGGLTAQPAPARMAPDPKDLT